jgi:hypothetical protein
MKRIPIQLFQLSLYDHSGRAAGEQVTLSMNGPTTPPVSKKLLAFCQRDKEDAADANSSLLFNVSTEGLRRNSLPSHLWM